MLSVLPVPSHNRRLVKRFIRLPHRLYRGNPHWVPLLDTDARRYFDRDNFPFYEYSDAAFFLAVQDGQDVGRIAVLEHSLFNQTHGVSQAQFYFFDTIDDLSVAQALIGAATDWATQRGLTRLVGPKGFLVLDGYGVLIQGFDLPQAMVFNNYNHAYYAPLLAAQGFTKVVDFRSAILNVDEFQPPAWVKTLVAQMRRRAEFAIGPYGSLKDLVAAGPDLFRLYNRAFADNWEYYPLSEKEITFMVNDLKPVAIPGMMQIMGPLDHPVGLLFGLPDLSAALRASHGRLTPWSIARLLWAKQRPRRAALVAIAVAEAQRRQGGNVLLIYEFAQILKAMGIQEVELINIAETAETMGRDLAALGIRPAKIHRVFGKEI